ncbi:MAG: 50S ribosomal protein L29 [Candidatus Brocadiia bacterium]
MLTLKEIRVKTTVELNNEIKNLHDEMMRLRFRKVTDDVENSSIFRKIRRNIAQLKTIINEKKTAEKNVQEKTDGKK